MTFHLEENALYVESTSASVYVYMDFGLHWLSLKKRKTLLNPDPKSEYEHKTTVFFFARVIWYIVFV